MTEHPDANFRESTCSLRFSTFECSNVTLRTKAVRWGGKKNTKQVQATEWSDQATTPLYSEELVSVYIAAEQLKAIYHISEIGAIVISFCRPPTAQQTKKDGEVTMNRTWGSGCCYVFFSSDDCRVYFWCEIAFSHLFGTEKHIWKALKWQDSSAAFIVVVYLELDLAITIQARKRSTFCSEETNMVTEKIYRIMN